MDARQQRILQAIIEAFIKTASPVGSKFIQEAYDFKVSSATIRSEMANLEEAGYIMQPHTSAGRVPTGQAYRMWVDGIKLDQPLFNQVRRDMQSLRRQHQLAETKERLIEVVRMLSSLTNNVSFATLPEVKRVFYLGIGNILKKPEFASDPLKATRVVERLEGDLYNVLLDLDVNDEGAVYIGDENILPEFQSCSLLAIPYEYKGFQGVIGLLGSMRMDYAYNLAALKVALELF